MITLQVPGSNPGQVIRHGIPSGHNREEPIVAKKTSKTNTAKTNTEKKDKPVSKKKKEKTSIAGNVIIHNYPETIEPTPLIPFRQTLAYVDLDTLVEAVERDQALNPRDQENVKRNAKRIAVEIAERGFENPGIFNVSEALGNSREEPGYLKGAGRTAALVELRRAMPDVFEARYGEGVPVYFVDVPTKEARARIISDHSQVMGLTSKIELFRTHWNMLESGAPRRQVIVATMGLLMAKPKGGRSLKKADEKDAEALKERNAKKRAALAKEALSFRLQAFQGQVQDRDEERKLPFVREAITLKLTGERPESGPLVSTEMLPDECSITKAEWQKILLPAFKADGAEFSRENPGPKYLEAWAKLCEAWASNVKIKPARSLSAAKLAKEAQGKARLLKSVLLYAAQAVASLDDEGNLVVEAADESEIASYGSAMVEAHKVLGLIEFAKTDSTLRAAWEEFASQVEGARTKDIEARVAAARSKVSS
jgi:hypothetical protein